MISMSYHLLANGMKVHRSPKLLGVLRLLLLPEGHPPRLTSTQGRGDPHGRGLVLAGQWLICVGNRSKLVELVPLESARMKNSSLNICLNMVLTYSYFISALFCCCW